jgi:hypothetical protein
MVDREIIREWLTKADDDFEFALRAYAEIPSQHIQNVHLL